MDNAFIKKIDQIGMIVRDIEKTAEYLQSNFGIGPFTVIDATEVPCEFRGKPMKMNIRAGLAQVGPVEIELLQPMGGETIWSEFLNANGEGLHHLGINLEDVDAEVAKLKERGFKVLSQGYSKLGQGNWYYLDTNKTGGLLLELKPTRKMAPQ